MEGLLSSEANSTVNNSNIMSDDKNIPRFTQYASIANQQIVTDMITTTSSEIGNANIMHLGSISSSIPLKTKSDTVSLQKPTVTNPGIQLGTLQSGNSSIIIPSEAKSEITSSKNAILTNHQSQKSQITHTFPGMGTIGIRPMENRVGILISSGTKLAKVSSQNAAVTSEKSPVPIGMNDMTIKPLGNGQGHRRPVEIESELAAPQFATTGSEPQLETYKISSISSERDNNNSQIITAAEQHSGCSEIFRISSISSEKGNSNFKDIAPAGKQHSETYKITSISSEKGESNSQNAINSNQHLNESEITHIFPGMGSIGIRPIPTGVGIVLPPGTKVGVVSTQNALSVLSVSQHSPEMKLNSVISPRIDNKNVMSSEGGKGNLIPIGVKSGIEPPLAATTAKQYSETDRTTAISSGIWTSKLLPSRNSQENKLIPVTESGVVYSQDETPSSGINNINNIPSYNGQSIMNPTESRSDVVNVSTLSADSSAHNLSVVPLHNTTNKEQYQKCKASITENKRSRVETLKGRHFRLAQEKLNTQSEIREKKESKENSSEKVQSINQNNKSDECPARKVILPSVIGRITTTGEDIFSFKPKNKPKRSALSLQNILGTKMEDFKCNGCNTFKCRVCHQHFIAFCELLEHYKMHRNKIIIECKYCGHCFFNRYSLEVHKEMHNSTNQKMFKCSKCGVCFGQSLSLSLHSVLHKNSDTLPNKAMNSETIGSTIDVNKSIVDSLQSKSDSITNNLQSCNNQDSVSGIFKIINIDASSITYEINHKDTLSPGEEVCFEDSSAHAISSVSNIPTVNTSHIHSKDPSTFKMGIKSKDPLSCAIKVYSNYSSDVEAKINRKDSSALKGKIRCKDISELVSKAHNEDSSSISVEGFKNPSTLITNINCKNLSGLATKVYQPRDSIAVATSGAKVPTHTIDLVEEMSSISGDNSNDFECSECDFTTSCESLMIKHSASHNFNYLNSNINENIFNVKRNENLDMQQDTIALDSDLPKTETDYTNNEINKVTKNNTVILQGFSDNKSIIEMHDSLPIQGSTMENDLDAENLQGKFSNKIQMQENILEEVDLDNMDIYIPEGWQREVNQETHLDGTKVFFIKYHNPQGNLHRGLKKLDNSMLEGDTDSAGLYIPDGWQRKVFLRTNSEDSVNFVVLYCKKIENNCSLETKKIDPSKMIMKNETETSSILYSLLSKKGHSKSIQGGKINFQTNYIIKHPYEQYFDYLFENKMIFGQDSLIMCKLCDHLFHQKINALNHAEIHISPYKQVNSNSTLFNNYDYYFCTACVQYLEKQDIKKHMKTHKITKVPNSIIINVKKVYVFETNEKMSLFCCDLCPYVSPIYLYMAAHLFQHIEAKTSTEKCISSMEIEIDNKGKYVPEGWQRKVYKVQTINSKPSYKVCYISPYGSKFYSKSAIYMSLKNLAHFGTELKVNLDKMDFQHPSNKSTAGRRKLLFIDKKRKKINVIEDDKTEICVPVGWQRKLFKPNKRSFKKGYFIAYIPPNKRYLSVDIEKISHEISNRKRIHITSETDSCSLCLTPCGNQLTKAMIATVNKIDNLTDKVKSLEKALTSQNEILNFHFNGYSKCGNNPRGGGSLHNGEQCLYLKNHPRGEASTTKSKRYRTETSKGRHFRLVQEKRKNIFRNKKKKEGKENSPEEVKSKNDSVKNVIVSSSRKNMSEIQEKRVKHCAAMRLTDTNPVPSDSTSNKVNNSELCVPEGWYRKQFKCDNGSIKDPYFISYISPNKRYLSVNLDEGIRVKHRRILISDNNSNQVSKSELRVPDGWYKKLFNCQNGNLKEHNLTSYISSDQRYLTVDVDRNKLYW